MNKLLVFFVVLIIILVILAGAIWFFLWPAPEEDISEIKEKVLTEKVEVSKKKTTETVKRSVPKTYWEKVYQLEEDLEKNYELQRRGVLSVASANEREAKILERY